jgi:hypothetical protein
MRRDEAGSCPGRNDHEHQWIEWTEAHEVGLVERYICGYCPARADELTAQGAARVAAGWTPPNGSASVPNASLEAPL